MSLPVWSGVVATVGRFASAVVDARGAVKFSDGSYADFGGQVTAQARVSASGDQIVVAAQVGPLDSLQCLDNQGHHWDSGVTAYGVNCVGIMPHPLGWQATVVLGAGASRPLGYYAQIVLGPDLTPTGAMQTRTIPIGPTTQGFLDLLAGGTPVWTDGNWPMSPAAGVTLALWREANGWIVGQDARVDRIVAIDPTGAPWVVWTGHTEAVSQIAALPNGAVLVAIGGHDLFIPREQFVPWTPADEPPCVVPTFAPAPRPVRVQIFGGPGFNMNIGPQHDDPTAPLSGIFATLGTDDVIGRAAQAAAAGVPLYAYVDDVSYPLAWVPQAAGVTVIPTVQAYPYREPRGGPMRPLAETVGFIRDTVAAMCAHHPRVAVVMAFYRQIDGDGAYNWPLQDVLDLQEALWPILCGLGVTDVLVFHWNRAAGKDGVVSRPEFVTALARLKAAADVPESQPQPVPAPAPQPKDHTMPVPVYLRTSDGLYVSPTADQKVVVTPSQPAQPIQMHLMQGKFDADQRVMFELTPERFMWKPGDDFAQMTLPLAEGMNAFVHRGARDGSWAFTFFGCWLSAPSPQNLPGHITAARELITLAYGMAMLDAESFDVIDARSGEVIRNPF